MNRQFFKLRIANRRGDHPAPHVLGGFGHRGKVLFRRCRRGELQHARKAHRDVLRRDHVHVPLGNLRRLLRGENNVAVIRENEHVLRVYAVDRAHERFDARVHRLAAVDDLVNAHLGEHLREAFAQGNRDDAIFFIGRFFGFHAGAFAPLFGHVLDLEVDQFAQREACLQRLAGIVGVHVYLNQRQIAHDEHAVADSLELAAEQRDIVLRRVGTDAVDQELGAVDVFQFGDRVVIVLEAGRAVLGHGNGLDHFAAQRRVHAGINQHQAASARVHNARLLEDGQHILRLGENRLAAGEHRREQAFHIGGGALRPENGRLRDHARDGENRALLGLHHGLIRRFRAGLERLRNLRRVHVLQARHAAGEPAEQLAEDNARVAARAAQRALGERVGRFVQPGIVMPVHLAHGGLRREGHVGAGVSVRHGENV